MNVIVTGCSRGIGKEIVTQLLSYDNIKNIIAISRSPINIHVANSKPILHCLNIDLLDFEKFPQTLTNYLNSNNIEHVDVLINNAGAIVNKPFQEILINDIDKVYDTNLKAPFILIQSLLPFLQNSKFAHIVNVSSMGGFMGSSKFAGLSAYSSSKGALVTLTECLAEEFKEKNISVNCLCIGAVNTEMLQEAFPGYVAPVSHEQMGAYISNFALTAGKLFNGKILPVSSSTP
ncbi:MAG: SDR family NAD(P)-dependent oxidoreductase [Bacteroidota bacterium]